MHFVYILECIDGSFYIGHTDDVGARYRIHQSGRGPAYTAKRLPVPLVYSEPRETLAQAVQRERQLTGWTRAKKMALIVNDKESLSVLSKCRASNQAVQ